MNTNRRSMGTLKTGLRAQRTNPSTSGPTSANRRSKLPKPASGAPSSSSRGRSGSMDRPRASLAAFSDFKTPRWAIEILIQNIFSLTFILVLSAETNQPMRVPRWATYIRILLTGILEVHLLPTQWWNEDEVQENEAQFTEWVDRTKIIDQLGTKIGKRKLF